MQYISGFTLASMSLGLMALVLILTYTGGMFSPSQMWDYHRIRIGFPAIANGAIWGNMVLLSAALYVIGGYSSQWKGPEIWLMLGLCLLVSYTLFQFVYLQGKFPDALAGGGRPISPAGWVMLIYSGAVYAAIGLFYLRTDATQTDVLVVAALLMLYLPVANHAVLGWLNSLYSFAWCPRIFAEESSPMRFIIGGEILVIAGTAIKLLR